MGRYESAMWESDPMAPTRKDRMSGEYHPYLPDLLTGREIALSMDAARSGSAAQRLLDVLPGNPVLSVASVARLTERSYPAARLAVRALEEAGV